MTDEEYVITLKNCASMLADGIKYMKEEHQKQFKEAYEKAIEALDREESVIKALEKVKAEVEAMYGVTDFCDGSLRIDKYEVLESIDRKIKEIKHDKVSNGNQVAER